MWNQLYPSDKDDNMFTFYDVEVFRHDWIMVFEQDGKITKIHNDKSALERFLSSVNFLVGYNNYNYDDKIIESVLKNLDKYHTSQKIINGKNLILRIIKHLTYEIMYEL